MKGMIIKVKSIGRSNKKTIQILCDFLEEQSDKVKADLVKYLDKYTINKYNISDEDEDSLIGSD